MHFLSVCLLVQAFHFIQAVQMLGDRWNRTTVHMLFLSELLSIETLDFIQAVLKLLNGLNSPVHDPFDAIFLESLHGGTTGEYMSILIMLFLSELLSIETLDFIQAVLELLNGLTS